MNEGSIMIEPWVLIVIILLFIGHISIDIMNILIKRRIRKLNDTIKQKIESISKTVEKVKNQPIDGGE